jgi:hypothetical protein
VAPRIEPRAVATLVGDRVSVSRQQRHTRQHRCPVCGGADGDPRGQGKRCSGFTSGDGEWVHCSREELAGALPQEDGGTYAHRMRGPCKCGQTHGEGGRSASREVVATYLYETAERVPLFRVVRTAAKDFYQQHPDGAGGWENGRNGIAPTLYRLPELAEDDADRTVYVVEGEKDVDTLAKRGFLATCNPGGAGKWHYVADVAKTVLEGRDVVVVADADKPGREHAAKVADCLRGVVRSLTVVQPTTPHKDVTDLLLAGGTLEELAPIEASEEQSEPEVPTAADPLRGLEYLSKVAVVGRQRLVELAERPVVWLWDQIATAGLTVLLAAGPGSGKTTLLFLLIAARANRGEPVRVLGRTMAPAPRGRYIVVIENEHSDESSARILRKSCARLGLDEEALEAFILVARQGVRIGSAEWQDVERLIAAGLVSDVVLDTLASSAPSALGDSNDETEQVATFDIIRRAINRAPSPDAWPTFWLAVHTRKCDGMPTMNDVAGSTQRAGQADVVLLMGAERSGDKVTAVKVAFGKVREKDAEDYPEPVTYTVTRSGVTVHDAPEDDGGPLEGRILAALATGAKTKTKLGTLLGRSGADIDAALTVLFGEHRIESVQLKVKGQPRKHFALRTKGDRKGYRGIQDEIPDVTDREGIPDEAPDEYRTSETLALGSGGNHAE